MKNQTKVQTQDMYEIKVLSAISISLMIIWSFLTIII